MKGLFKLFLVILAFVVLERFCYKQTDGFAREKICSDLAYHAEWNTQPLSLSDREKVLSILDQPFTYLGKGAQSYVFESQDKNYVIKFFRHSHIRPPFWVFLPLLPPFLKSYKERKIAYGEGKASRDFMSYKIAFEEMPEETGLIYLHLNKTNDLKKQATIYDKIGIVHKIDLDHMEFLLQKKAQLIYPTLQSWIDQGKLDRARDSLSDLVRLLSLRCDKGIFDKDPDLNTNFGFAQGRAIQIDVGRFRKETGKKTEKRDELVKITDHLKQWLDRKSPDLSLYLQNEVRNCE